ncbi:phosphopantetheine-binding protein [Vibrio sp. PP-XX7]
MIPVKSAITVDKLREYLVDRVPHYAVPHFINFIEEFPLTAHGKVDRDKLPIPINTTPVQVAASTEMEQEIAQVWQQVLSLADVGVEDNFFALGGDSISAIRVVAKLIRGPHCCGYPGYFFSIRLLLSLLLVAEERLDEIDQGMVAGQFPLKANSTPGALSTFGEEVSGLIKVAHVTS